MTSYTALDYDHPVLQPWKLVLDTPAMTQLRHDLNQWLWTGIPGAVVAGPARVGKTTAIERVFWNMVDRSNRPVPVFRVSIPLRDQSTMVSVYRQLCFSANLKVLRRDTADQLADRFIHYVSDAMHEADVVQAALVVDECQRLTPRQFNAFAELYDKLRLNDRILLIVFVGNDTETWSLLDGMDPSYFAHLHGRFFRIRRNYRGIASAEEVKYCLAQYDRLRHPPKTGPTFVAHYLPDAVNNGFRLASAASLFWRVFRGFQKQYRFDSWGMQSFSITTNTLLSDFLPRYGADALDEEMVEEAIRMSCLVPSLVKALN